MLATLMLAVLFGFPTSHPYNKTPGMVTTEDVIVGCDRNIKIDHIVKLDEIPQMNGTLMELFDRNDDGVGDIQAFSYIVGYKPDGERIIVEHSQPAFLYIVDLDFDNTFDMVYVDHSGTGDCNSIKPYRNLRDPKSAWPDYDTPDGALTGDGPLPGGHP